MERFYGADDVSIFYKKKKKCKKSEDRAPKFPGWDALAPEKDASKHWRPLTAVTRKKSQ